MNSVANLRRTATLKVGMKNYDLNAIFPRLYAILPKVGKVDVKLSHENSPVESEFVGDIVILYGCDKGATYEIISHKQLRELKISKEELHEIAVGNLTNTEKEIRLHKGDNFHFITCDGDLEASLILHASLWDYVSEKIGGDIIAAVPARNTLLLSGTTKVELSALKKKTCECLENAHRPLSLKLFLRLESNWKEYEV